MGKPKISILIPVYNAEQYLDQCLESCINQTYENIEVICVNDGSYDNSLNILNEFALKDNRFKIYTQENAGIAKAYETAVQNASGEWIYLLDNDDWLKPDAMEKLVDFSNKYKKADFIYCKYYTAYTNGEYKVERSPIHYYRSKGRKKFKNYLSPFKFFKKSLYNNVIFPYKMCDWQDSCLSWQLTCNAKHIVIADLNVYYYRVRQDSVSHSIKDPYRNYLTFVDVLNTIKQFLINTGRWNIEKWTFYRWSIIVYKNYIKKNVGEKQQKVFNDFKDFLNCIDDNILYAFSHVEECFLIKYCDLKTYNEYRNIKKWNLIGKILYALKHSGEFKKLFIN